MTASEASSFGTNWGFGHGFEAKTFSLFISEPPKRQIIVQLKLMIVICLLSGTSDKRSTDSHGQFHNEQILPGHSRAGNQQYCWLASPFPASWAASERERCSFSPRGSSTSPTPFHLQPEFCACCTDLSNICLQSGSKVIIATLSRPDTSSERSIYAKETVWR